MSKTCTALARIVRRHKKLIDEQYIKRVLIVCDTDTHALTVMSHLVDNEVLSDDELIGIIGSPRMRKRAIRQEKPFSVVSQSDFDWLASMYVPKTTFDFDAVLEVTAGTGVFGSGGLSYFKWLHGSLDTFTSISCELTD